MIDNEPSMSKIDDYNGNESKEKRSTVNKVIIICLAVGALLVALKLTYNNPGDYVGTQENPGINTAR
jgi:cell division protein FtsL